MEQTLKPSPTLAGMSGIQEYTITSRGARVTLTSGEVRTLTKAQLPKPEKISVFSIADALYDAR